MKSGTKYYPLYEYLQVRSGGDEALEFTFAEVEAILEASLPHAARRWRSWWANTATTGRVQAAAWMEAGYHVGRLDLEAETVTFVRAHPPYRTAPDPSTLEWNAETVRALRQHMGLTQQELADRLNMRQQTISEWETGAYSPRGGSVALLNLVAERARFYAVSTEDEESEPPSSEA
jgi:DNA-binding transcriptional regulator YiaG